MTWRKVKIGLDVFLEGKEHLVEAIKICSTTLEVMVAEPGDNKFTTVTTNA